MQASISARRTAEAVKRLRAKPPLLTGLSRNAALAGQGLCLAWAGILDDLLDAGRLVRVSSLEASSSRGYFVTYDRSLPRDNPARVIAQFLASVS
jgi:LysR family glycine cleavage system transcriptional activator